MEAELGVSTHHHANLCMCLVIYSLVQHNVHELVKASQGACDLPVAIQGHCQPAQVEGSATVVKGQDWLPQKLTCGP